MAQERHRRPRGSHRHVLAAVGMSAANVVGINAEIASAQSAIESSAQEEPRIPLSATGKNVVVLMMDRSASCYLPALMYEKPELQEILDGFTYYPNTVSFGSATNVGAPALYGGYEYTPERMNERADTPLSEKHDEALKVMPVLFDQNGYDVTVCDPSYAGYSWIPDLGIYDDYPDIKAFVTQDGRYDVEGFELSSTSDQEHAAWMRNFFCYSIFKIAPLVLQPALYNNGAYNSTNLPPIQIRDSISMSTGVESGFMNSFGVLEHLEDITEITQSDSSTFLMMANETTHEPILLSEPDYIPAWKVDNTEYGATRLVRQKVDGGSVTLASDTQMIHYHANMAAFLKLGAWLDYLRENGVFDNTRIIIVSDHAWPLGQNDEIIVGDEGSGDVWDASVFNCMLLVKDFDASGPLQTDTAFMTNADTPVLAMQGLINAPVNPFTGATIDSSDKNAPELHLQYATYWQVNENNGNTFLPGNWFAVHDDITVNDNWRFLGEY